MKKKLIIGIIVLLFILIDLSVLLYPTVSEYVNSHSQSRVVTKYVDEVSGLSGAKTKAALEAARVYNRTLLEKEDRFKLTPAETAAYEKLLNTGSGVMGILVIDKLNIKLPIYHGSDEGVLAVGLGHIPGSSLPVGGVGTHTVIDGHRGLPSAKLLTELDRMAVGDSFILYVMGETLTYEVDQILTVLPDDTRALDIDPKQDYCTLFTCTPYGINTHRLLVRGHRVATADTGWAAMSADASRLDKARIIVIFLIPAAAGLSIYVLIKSKKIRKGANIL